MRAFTEEIYKKFLRLFEEEKEVGKIYHFNEGFRKGQSRYLFFPGHVGPIFCFVKVSDNVHMINTIIKSLTQYVP